MATINHFTEIICWQKARVLAAKIDALRKCKDFSSDVVLSNQIRSSSLSVMANIAEGFGRKGDKQFSYFIDISIASLQETQSHLFAAHDSGYVSKEQINELVAAYEDVKRISIGLKKSIR